MASAPLLSKYTVVLTTYGTMASEAPAKDKQAVKLGKQGSASAPVVLDHEQVRVRVRVCVRACVCVCVCVRACADAHVRMCV